MYADLCRKSRIDEADTYNFLRLFGRECAGALSIFSEEADVPHADEYRDITDELENLLEKHKGMPQHSLIAETKARLSIAGAQNNLWFPITTRRGKISSNVPFLTILSVTVTLMAKTFLYSINGGNECF